MGKQQRYVCRPSSLHCEFCLIRVFPDYRPKGKKPISQSHLRKYEAEFEIDKVLRDFHLAICFSSPTCQRECENQCASSSLQSRRDFFKMTLTLLSIESEFRETTTTRFCQSKSEKNVSHFPFARRRPKGRWTSDGNSAPCAAVQFLISFFRLNSISLVLLRGRYATLNMAMMMN